jgi:ribosomal protein L29
MQKIGADFFLWRRAGIICILVLKYGGQSLVVWAINEGRGAARECDRFLMGETALP